MLFKKTIPSIAVWAVLTVASGSFWPEASAETTLKKGEPVTLNFTNADIESVARTMSTLTGRNVVVDPRVKGTLTLTSEAPVSPAAAYGQFLALLRLQGFAVVQSDGLDKLVPEADAKLQGGTVALPETAPAGVAGNQLVTQIIRVQHENANNLVAVLRPLISPNNTINVSPGNNTLVITDYADNLRRLNRIISALDVANATDLEVLTLQHANASDLAPLVLRLLEGSGSGAGGAAGDAGFRTTILAEPRSNALVVRTANQARMALVKSLVSKLDQPNSNGANGAAGNIYVVYLKNAIATQLATTLRAAISADGRGTSSGAAASASPSLAAAGGNAPGSSASSNNAPSTGGQIQADPSTNSLIITASEPQYRQIRAVIDKLDARRAQVYVESLIAEISADKAAQFGIQWQGVLGRSGDTNVGVLGTNFGSGGSNILALTTGEGTVLPPTGLNIGIGKVSDGVFLGVLARFIESSGSGNVLSTPNLLTLDNEEAKIIIAQNVPFVTGQYTNTGGGGSSSVNPFQTIERKDVGLTLKVRPQISENGTVRLAVYQEVSSVVASTANAANGPTTNKRSIESNVLVEDGSIVVLGGLLQDEYGGNDDKVPGLGDIPLFGNLFKSESRSRKKTNLMVFLRPVVLRDAASTERMTLDRYDFIRSGQQQAQPEPSVMVPINESVILPPAPAKAP